MLVFSGCSEIHKPLGQNEALRTNTEFADGTHRGMYDPETDCCGFPDEGYDATTAMVINWHRMPETNSLLDARMRYRLIHPRESGWTTADGESMEFWVVIPHPYFSHLLESARHTRCPGDGFQVNSVYQS